MTKTPDFRHLVLRDMVDYLKGRGFPTVEANKRAEKLMEFVDREAARFAADESGDTGDEPTSQCIGCLVDSQPHTCGFKPIVVT